MLISCSAINRIFHSDCMNTLFVLFTVFNGELMFVLLSAKA